MSSLRYKIGFSFFLLVCISLATSVVALYNLSQLRSSVGKIFREHLQSVLAAQHMSTALEQQDRAQESMLYVGIALPGTPGREISASDQLSSALDIFNKNRDDFLWWLGTAKDSVTVAPKPAVIDSIVVEYNAYLRASDSLYKLLKGAEKRGKARAFQQSVVLPIAQVLAEESYRYLEFNQMAVASAENRAKEATSNSALAVLFTSILAIVIILFASLQFTRTIIRPAERLTEIARRIGRGQLNQKIDITTNDEIGELGQEFNKMTERLREYEAMNVHELIAEKKKSEAIVASIADPVIVTDQKNHLLMMNQAAMRVLNVGQHNWQAKTLGEIVQDKRWLPLLTPESAQEGEQATRDLLLSVQEGEQTLYFRPRQTTIIDERENIQGVVTLLQDVTRFKNLDRMKSEFMATVSHELRTPLTSINMAIDILSQEVLGEVNERQLDMLSTAKDDCERLTKLVRELLDLSRLESGRYELKREKVNVRSLVDEALKPLRLQFQEKNIHLRMEVSLTLPEVSGDQQQLSWVVTNLVSNALRYTPPDGHVTIRSDLVDDSVRLSVADSGRGIPPDAVEVIFDKFVQVKQATESTPGSVGLGLAIAKEVVEAHGGRIWVESIVGHGSTFFFTVPLSRQS